MRSAALSAKIFAALPFFGQNAVAQFLHLIEDHRAKPPVLAISHHPAMLEYLKM
jgi:hypothetical protein